MNWLDIVVLILLGIGLIKGLRDGVIKQIVAIGALIIGIYLCTSVAQLLCGYLLQLEWFPQQAVKLTSYFLGFVLIVGVILLAGKVVHKLVSVTPLSMLNHLAGGFLGVLLMVLFMSFLLNVIEVFDLLSQELKVESNFYYKIKNIIPNVFPGDLFKLKIDAIE